MSRLVLFAVIATFSIFRIYRYCDVPNYRLSQRPVIITLFSGGEGSSHLTELLHNHGLCTLGFEPIDCYDGPCLQLDLLTNKWRRHRLFRLLLKAASSDSENVFREAISRAANFSSLWNYRHEAIHRWAGSCNWRRALGFTFKLRLEGDDEVIRLANEQKRRNVKFISLYRNPMHQAVSMERAHAGLGQFEKPRKHGALILNVSTLLKRVTLYLEEINTRHRALTVADESFAVISYETLCMDALGSLNWIFEFMGMRPAPGLQSSPDSFERSSPHFRDKLLNLPQICDELKNHNSAPHFLLQFINHEC